MSTPLDVRRGPRHGQGPRPGPPPRSVIVHRVRRRPRPPRWLPGFVLLLPSLLAIGLFVYGFIGWNVRVSLTSWRGLSPTYDNVGLRNYLNLWSDERWRLDVRNALIFTTVHVATAGLVLTRRVERRLDRLMMRRAVKPLHKAERVRASPNGGYPCN